MFSVIRLKNKGMHVSLKYVVRARVCLYLSTSIFTLIMSEREVIVRDGCMHKHVCVSVCYSWCRDVSVLTCILISRDLLPNVSSLTFAGVFSLVFLCNN